MSYFFKRWSLILIFNLLIYTACSSVNGYNPIEPYILKFYTYLGLEPDNLAEEVLEDVIKNKTGIDFDITSSTKEL